MLNKIISTADPIFHKGSTRVVYTIGDYAFKFPRVYPGRFIGLLFSDLKHEKYYKSYRDFKDYWDFQINRASSETWGVLKSFLFWGLIANRRESKLWRDTQHQLLAPTIFSMFGLVNIQRRGTSTNIKGIVILNTAIKITQDPLVLRDHAFEHTDNWKLIGSSMKLVDYGNQDMPEIIRNHGDRLYSGLQELIKDRP